MPRQGAGSGNRDLDVKVNKPYKPRSQARDSRTGKRLPASKRNRKGQKTTSYGKYDASDPMRETGTAPRKPKVEVKRLPPIRSKPSKSAMEANKNETRGDRKRYRNSITFEGGAAKSVGKPKKNAKSLLETYKRTRGR